MLKLSEQEKEWVRIMEESTNPQEIIETAAKLKMDPVTMEEAMEIVEMHKETKIPLAEQQRPTWDDFFSVESREEKIALLDKMFGGSLTPEEIERFLAIE